MNNNNDKGMNAILKGVGLLIDEKTSQSSFDKTVSGIITYADYETNTYSVRINGYDYQHIPSTIKVKVNDSVLITCPQNQISQMFICSKIDNTNYLDNTRYTSNTTIKVNNDIKGIITGTTTVSLQLNVGSAYMLYGASYTPSTGALGNNSIHVIYTSLLDADTLATPTKLHGTTSLPYTITVGANQTLKLQNVGINYNAYFALQKIF